MAVTGRIIGLSLALGCCGLAGGGNALAFQPTGPIEVVVHSAPGGGSDVFARALAEIVTKEKLLSQPLRIVNKTAGAGLEAMAYLVEKKGADHTIAIFTNTWVATPLTRKDAKHTVKDLTPVVRLVLEPTIAVVRGDSPYKSMSDFVAAAKKDPGALKQAGGSVTAIESLTGLLLQSATGAKWTFIPTPAIKDRIGGVLAGDVHIIIPQPQDVNDHIATGAKWTFIPTPAIKDRIGGVLAGDVHIIIPQPQDVNDHIAAGRLRPIAALTEKRLAMLPNLPTIKEQGINVPIIANARGVLAPPGVAKEVVEFWEDFFARLVKTPSWRKYLEENQVEDVFIKGGELGPFLDEQTVLMRSVLQQAGVTVAR